MANIEKNTDELQRKKYFVDQKRVLVRKDKPVDWRANGFSRVIESSEVVLSPSPVRPLLHTAACDSPIKIDVVRENDRVRSVRISCPCGRHAELDCEYSSEKEPCPEVSP